MKSFLRWILFSITVFVASVGPANAALYTASYGAVLPSSSNCDDCFDGPQAFPGSGQSINFFGSIYSDLYVGSNGYVTFGTGQIGFTPSPLNVQTLAPMIAGEFTDLDSQNDAGSNVYVNNSTPGQLIVTWEAMGPCCGTPFTSLSTFQLVIRSDQFVIPPGEGQIGFFFGPITETQPASAGFGDGLLASNPGEQSIYSGDPSVYSNHAPIWFTLGAGGVPADTTPDAFTFTDQTGVALSALLESNVITVAGIDAPVSVAISGAGGEYAVSTDSGANWSAWSTSVPATISVGNQIKVRHTSSSSVSTQVDTVLTIGGVSDTFSTTTAASDTVPDAFNFTAQTGAALSSVGTSNTIIVAGIDAPANISIVGGTYKIGNGSYVSTPGTVINGDTVTVQLTASASPSTLTTATLTIGGVAGAFDVTTLAADTTPTAFSFTAQTGVTPGSVATSNSIIVTGINGPSNISIVGGTYKIGSGSYVSTPGTVINGDTVTVQLTASASPSTLTTATLTIGGVSAVFNVTTQPLPATVTGIPTLSEWGMMILAGLLLMMGLVQVRRRS
jgi:hypothetical protein